MTDPSLSADELAALRRRWEQGATAQLALQLAEEYKRRSEHDLAVAVLEKALADNPSHLAVRVAAGRLRLELGDLAAAASDLEQVVERDPTHLVANKLLVRVYTGLGEPLRARDRLDLYRLLNEGDPEIEELEALVPPEGWVEPSPAAAEEPGEPEHAVEAGTEPEAGPLPALEPQPASASVAIPAPLDDAPFDGETSSASEATAPGGDDPFPGLWDDLDTAGYWHRVEDGQIFGGEPAPAEPAAPEPPEKAAVDEPAAEEGEEPWPGSVAVVAEPAPLPDAGSETAVHTEAAVPEEPAEEKSRAASVTLAALYHQQGHLEEARRTYWQVLEREPSNREALEGLARMARSGSTGLTAFDLLGDDIPGDAAARRRRVLEGYLARLGRGGEDDVV